LTTSGDDGIMPILGNDATLPPVFAVLQSTVVATVTAADAVAVLQLAVTSQSSSY